jgi:hypothetical protein
VARICASSERAGQQRSAAPEGSATNPHRCSCYLSSCELFCSIASIRCGPLSLAREVWARALRSSLGACGVFGKHFEVLWGVRCLFNTLRSFGGEQLLVFFSNLFLQPACWISSLSIFFWFCWVSGRICFLEHGLWTRTALSKICILCQENRLYINIMSNFMWKNSFGYRSSQTGNFST